MSRFKYRFAEIKKIKETLEKKAQKELSVLEYEIERQQEEILRILKEKSERKTNLIGEKTRRLSDLQFGQHYERLLDSKVREARAKAEKLEQQKEEKLLELRKRSRERKTFELLEEKHRAEYNEEQMRLERIEFDDIATKKFIRGKKEIEK